LRRWGEQIGRFARPNILFYDERVFDLYHRICAQYRMGEDTEERKVAQRSGRTTSATKNVARDPFCSQSTSGEAIGNQEFLVADAVERNRSPLNLSLFSGNLTGKFAIFRPWGRFHIGEAAVPQRFFTKFPKKNNRAKLSR
jgi:hypothetical protein